MYLVTPKKKLRLISQIVLVKTAVICVYYFQRNKDI